jgi:hypothetical protein
MTDGRWQSSRDGENARASAFWRDIVVASPLIHPTDGIAVGDGAVGCGTTAIGKRSAGIGLRGPGITGGPNLAIVKRYIGRVTAGICRKSRSSSQRLDSKLIGDNSSTKADYGNRPARGHKVRYTGIGSDIGLGSIGGSEGRNHGSDSSFGIVGRKA